MIGYGNTLRSDDGVGAELATQIEQRQFLGVRVLCQHQLTPELAAAIAGADAVVFLDAALSPAVEVRRLSAVGEPEMRSHAFEPSTLLKLAQTLFGRCPPGWIITVPAQDFDFKAGFSPVAREGLREAIGKFEELWREVVRGGT